MEEDKNRVNLEPDAMEPVEPPQDRNSTKNDDFQGTKPTTDEYKNHVIVEPEDDDAMEPAVLPPDENLVKTEDSTNGDKPTTLDEYAYKDMSYTSEIFKLELRGLPKYYGIGQLRKFLTKKMGLKISKVKAPAQKSRWAYVCFPSAEERDKALSELNGAAFKSCTLEAKIANPAPDPFVKRKNEEAREGSNKRPKVETEEEQSLLLQNNVSPLWNVPYEDQARKAKERRRRKKKLKEKELRRRRVLAVRAQRPKAELSLIQSHVRRVEVLK